MCPFYDDLSFEIRFAKVNKNERANLYLKS